MLSLTLAGVFALIAALHFYWATGGQWGLTAAIPDLPQADGTTRPAFVPGALATAVVGLIFAGVALTLLMYSAWLPSILPAVWLRIVVGLLGVVLLLRAIGDFKYVGFTKRVKGTLFAKMDTRFYSPLCLLLGAGVFWLLSG